jgi:CheY-like chemotaxis protein
MTAPNPVQHLALFEASLTPLLLVDHEAGVIVAPDPAAARFIGRGPRAGSGPAITALSAEAPARPPCMASQAAEPGPGPEPDVAATAGPASVADPAGPAATAGDVAPSAAATILVVDDEAVLRAIAERVLVLAGHRVLVAVSGEEALAIAATEGPIDLLFTDVVMPGMHGIALASALRAERPGLRVLVTSGYTPGDVDRHGAGLADTPFLPKPYTPAQLTRAVAALLAVAPEG